jgi:site-specific DNA-cytosine methylase
MNVLNTKDFLLPQNRERVFMVGRLIKSDNGFDFPK